MPILYILLCSSSNGHCCFFIQLIPRFVTSKAKQIDTAGGKAQNKHNAYESLCLMLAGEKGKKTMLWSTQRRNYTMSHFLLYPYICARESESEMIRMFSLNLSRVCWSDDMMLFHFFIQSSNSRNTKTHPFRSARKSPETKQIKLFLLWQLVYIRIRQIWLHGTKSQITHFIHKS